MPKSREGVIVIVLQVSIRSASSGMVCPDFSDFSLIDEKIKMDFGFYVSVSQ
jgi:hypothetical protein